MGAVSQGRQTAVFYYNVLPVRRRLLPEHDSFSVWGRSVKGVKPRSIYEHLACTATPMTVSTAHSSSNAGSWHSSQEQCLASTQLDEVIWVVNEANEERERERERER